MAQDALNQPLALLRASTGEGAIAGGTAMAEGARLHPAPGLELAGRWRSPAGRLLELEAEVSGTGGWLGLHLPLGPADHSGAGFAGLVCRSAAPRQEMIRACLRSGTPEGFSDCFFERHILARPEPATHLDALHLASQHRLPDRAEWRELVLFLPRQSFAWHLHDLRLFLI